MSQSGVEVVLGMAAAYGERGTEGALEFLDPEIEWRTRPDLPDTGVYRGADGFRHLMARFDEVMSDMHYEALDIIDAGERVIVQLQWGGTGKGSGVQVVETEETWIFTVDGAKIVRVDEFATKQEALEAAGIGQR